MLEAQSATMSAWIHFVDLVKEDHWVSGVIGAIVALAFSGAIMITRWAATRTHTLASLHFRDAKQFNGDWYLFHWNLIKVTEHKIRMSRLRLHRRLNGTIEAVQAHPQSGNAVFKGKVKFDNQNFYLALDCVNDSDVKSMTFHRIVDEKALGVRYTVGVMAGITHERNPYACRVILAERPLPAEVLEELLGPRRIALATSTDRDRLLSIVRDRGQAKLSEPDASEFTSPLLDV